MIAPAIKAGLVNCQTDIPDERAMINSEFFDNVKNAPILPIRTAKGSESSANEGTRKNEINIASPAVPPFLMATRIISMRSIRKISAKHSKNTDKMEIMNLRKI